MFVCMLFFFFLYVLVCAHSLVVEHMGEAHEGFGTRCENARIAGVAQHTAPATCRGATCDSI